MASQFLLMLGLTALLIGTSLVHSRPHFDIDQTTSDDTFSTANTHGLLVIPLQILVDSNGVSICEDCSKQTTENSDPISLSELVNGMRNLKERPFLQAFNGGFYG
ncbi:hypothetical protein M3Y94_00105700 [Aphelenchoides besseyi]|nr:hypothetical protein M3Y94_00105700 [Aphelenchoides besseyi]KAI6237550.1 hypothetical protein M3Y95_00276900 [Aphelenchoides besseyi]